MNNWTCTKSRTDLNLCLTSGVEVDPDPGKKYLRDRGPSLNQYCLLRDFKCPQIKLISIIQKSITTNTTYLPWYTVCIACLHYWSASLNQHCHTDTRQRQLNLCISVGRICPWQYWLGLAAADSHPHTKMSTHDAINSDDAEKYL